VLFLLFKPRKMGQENNAIVCAGEIFPNIFLDVRFPIIVSDDPLAIEPISFRTRGFTIAGLTCFGQLRKHSLPRDLDPIFFLTRSK
jgi:hypothetical protein